MNHTSGYLHVDPDPNDKTERDGKRLCSSGSQKTVEFYESADSFHLRVPKTDSMRQKIFKLIVDYYERAT